MKRMLRPIAGAFFALLLLVVAPQQHTAALAANFGATPLNDLGSGTYLGFAGGLYENGTNQPPADHGSNQRDAGLRQQEKTSVKGIEAAQILQVDWQEE